jgi:hypothetical protein
MEQHQNGQLSQELSLELVTIMTTEHNNLQNGRSLTTAEANGRSSLFVGAVSSGLIALTFVGQIAQLGTAFFVFSLVVIPTLLFMGLLTFTRVLQAGLADLTYARGINRIRHLYLEYAPQLQPYFILSTHDDWEGVLGHEAMGISWRQVFFNIPSMIAVINSVLVGGFVGLLLAAFTFPLGVSAGAGVVMFLLSVTIHQRYQWKQGMRQVRSVSALFPSQSA